MAELPTRQGTSAPFPNRPIGGARFFSRRELNLQRVAGYPAVCAGQGRWAYRKQKCAAATAQVTATQVRDEQTGPCKARHHADTSSALLLPPVTRLKPVTACAAARSHALLRSTATRFSMSAPSITPRQSSKGLQGGGKRKSLPQMQAEASDILSAKPHSLSDTASQLCTCRIRAGKAFLKPHCNSTETSLHFITSK